MVWCMAPFVQVCVEKTGGLIVLDESFAVADNNSDDSAKPPDGCEHST